MINSLAPSIKIGSRSSSLAMRQSTDALKRLQELLHFPYTEIIPFSSPGDRDKKTDLKESPDDFFTADLDRALLEGTLDAALHSAKDCPEKYPPGIEWFWLPWGEERRDALILRPGATPESLPHSPVIGTSSERREIYAQQRFPNGIIAPLRGNIEERLAQLDSGDYDVIIMAAAALIRLGLCNRITSLIPLAELSPPEGQGKLSVTFRSDDRGFQDLRKFFLHPVRFVGAGPGRASLCTTEGIDALRNCDICLYDSLLDKKLLSALSPEAEARFVGKREGLHLFTQREITPMLCNEARKGKRVVRLKGGDPGIFGRLREEIDALHSTGLPFSITPGISTFQCAAADNGLFLTSRRESPGFAAVSARKAGGGVNTINDAILRNLPVVVYMGISQLQKLVQQRLESGSPPETPVSVIFGAGTERSLLVEGDLTTIVERVNVVERGQLPGLIIFNPPPRGWKESPGLLGGLRVLITGGERIRSEAKKSLLRWGGIPISLPLIRQIREERLPPLRELLQGKSIIIITSPAGASLLIKAMCDQEIDLRTLPALAVPGSGTAAIFQQAGIFPEWIAPSPYGSASLLTLFRENISRGEKIVRLRSDVAGEALSKNLLELGFSVEDHILYRTEMTEEEPLPAFDSPLFASSSAVRHFVNRYGKAPLADKSILAIGRPTRTLLQESGITNIITGTEATCSSLIEALAIQKVEELLQKRKSLPTKETNQ